MKKQRRPTARGASFLLVLISGILLVAFWLSAPDREKPSDLEIGIKINSQRIVQNPDPEISQQAEAAPEALQHIQEAPEPVDQVLPQYDSPNGTVGFASAEGSAEVVEGQENLLRERLAALEEQQNEERLEAVNQLWYYAADHGVPEEALEALYELVQDPDPAIAEQALSALEDLWSLQEKSEADDRVQSEYDNSDDPEGLNLVTAGLEIGIPEASEEWTILVLDAVHETDEDRRADAVDAVALQRHDDAVAALTDVAAFDPSSEIRYQTLEALWYAAADGLDAKRLIKATLEEALEDLDPDVSALAKRALEDLQVLE